MDLPRPEPTIEQLLSEFLADQGARLSPKDYGQDAVILDLYESYLERYWPGRTREKNAAGWSDGTYCGTFGADDLIGGLSEFLSDFLPREVEAADARTMRTARAVIKRLGAWLVVKGYRGPNDRAGDQGAG